MGLAAINIKFTADLRGFSTEMQNSVRRIGALGKELQNTGRNLSTYVSLPLVAAGAAAVKFASDYNESLNKVDVAFGTSAQSVKDFAKTSLENFGIAEGTALDMAATYGDMATALGLPVEKAGAMSKSLVGLAGDLASFKNISVDIANTALAGIFTGETESLKKLGIVMTEANLQAFALSQGINKQMKDMSQAEKVGLRYNYILSVTKNSQGDFARTGGGAANQMRIFQESLKQVGQQLGAVILPVFTKLITFVNGAIKSFSGLSDETKTTIVVIAGIAAAIGPLLTVMGSMLTLVPNVVTKFNSLKDAFSGLQAVLLANPFTAIAVALAAIVGLAIASESRFTALTDAKKELSDVNDRATSILAKESAELTKNLAIAKNKSLTDEVRKKAIDSINAAYPALNNALTLENALTSEGEKLTNKLTDALLRKARVQASEEKLVEVQKKLLDLQLGQLEAVKPSVWQTLGNAIKGVGNSAVFTALQAASMGKNIGTETDQLTILQNVLTTFIGKNKEYSESNDAANLSLTDLIANQEKQLKVGTIGYYEKQIDGLQKLQKEIPTTNAAWQTYEDQITSIQKKIDAIEGKGGIKLPRPELPTLGENDAPEAPTFSLGELKDQKAYFEGLREQFSTTADEYVALSEQINNTDIRIKAIEGVDEFVQSVDDVKKSVYDLGPAISEAVQNGVAAIAEGFGNMIAGMIDGSISMDNVGAALLGQLGDLIIQLGKAAIKIGLAMIVIKAAFENPLAPIAIGIGLIAFGQLIKNAIPKGFQGGGAYANGGIVGGSSFYGDKILARVNSGELILNNKQQKSLYGMMNSGSAASAEIVGAINIKGSDLEVVLSRYLKEKGRLG